MNKNSYDSSVITLALVKYAGVKPRTFDLLLRDFGSVENVLAAEMAELEKFEGLSRNLAGKEESFEKKLEKAANYKKELKQRDINIITRYDTGYPRTFFEINDPPPLFYSRGKLPDENVKIIAIAGAENATQGGIALTTTLTKELVARHIEIVSSLTLGIDSAAHIGAKSAGGHSFAVLDCGFDHISGDVEIPLAIDIVQGGGVISEYPPEKEFSEKSYKQTNRLIAGMAQAVVVTEFYENSKRALDILEYCNQVGKLCFILIDPAYGALSDETALAQAVNWGAVPMSGLDQIDQIVKVLV